MADGLDAAEKAKRVRSLLSSYYTAGSEATTQSRAAASIDSAAFDTDAYIANLVRLADRGCLWLGAVRCGLVCCCALLTLHDLCRPPPAKEGPPGPAAEQVCVHGVRDSVPGQRHAGARASQGRGCASCGALSTARLRPCQMLVYENYSKFITATDTIRRMKGNVESMGGRVEELQVRLL